MTESRTRLPQLAGGIFITDGGLETTLVFHEGYDLPLFAAFVLLETAQGRATLERYFANYLEIAAQGRHGFVLETPTWRASREWGEQLGYSPEAIAAINREAVDFVRLQGARFAGRVGPLVISGCIGPRGDGYAPDSLQTPDQARSYHAHQIGALTAAGVDHVTAITMTHTGEAIGITRAAQEAGIPAVISFTLETDGRLPSGESLAEAIAATDAATGAGPAYYMLNCAHPTHFAHVLRDGGSWVSRIQALRANSSKLSHAELDIAETLDEGDPAELAEEHVALRALLPKLNVLGGCCGTDHRHVGAIAARCGHTSNRAEKQVA